MWSECVSFTQWDGGPEQRGSDAESKEETLVDVLVCSLLTYCPHYVGMRKYIFGRVKMLFRTTAETHRNNGGAVALAHNNSGGK